MVFVEGNDYRQLRRPGDDPAQFRSVVRPVQVPVAPDSVVHQYRGENFTTSTWTDSVGNADMSINGVSSSTLNGDRSASSDGVDDFGVANGPQDLPENETFGIAMVIRADQSSSFERLIGVQNGTAKFIIIDFTATGGNSFGFEVQDNNNNGISASVDGSVLDNQPHLIVINVDSTQGPAGIDIYADSMSAPTATSLLKDQPFDATNYSMDFDMGFFARNELGNPDKFKALDLPFIEFNEQPYSQQDRLDLKQRAPGL
jgi:hypothetical protein